MNQIEFGLCLHEKHSTFGVSDFVLEIQNDYAKKRKSFDLDVKHPEKTVQKIVKFIYDNIDLIVEAKNKKTSNKKTVNDRKSLLSSFNNKSRRARISKAGDKINMSLNINNDQQLIELIEFIKQKF